MVPVQRPAAGAAQQSPEQTPIEPPLLKRVTSPTPHDLRLAAAGVSTSESAFLRGAVKSIKPALAIGTAGIVVGALRMTSDARTLRADIIEDGFSANSAESAAKLTRNAVRVGRGLTHVAVSLGAHLAPGLSIAAAVLDTAVAAAIEANPESTSMEKSLARAASVAAVISATGFPVVGQISGIVATGLGLWRDTYGDDRRGLHLALEGPEL